MGYLVFGSDSLLGKFVLRLADLLILGVLLGYMTNSARFLGAFKKDLEDIIYGESFVSQRKDIYPIWERVSQALFGNRFPGINSELLDSLKKYFPEEDAYYQDNYASQTVLKWQNKKEGLLIAKDTVSFNLISETIQPVYYRCQTWTQSKDRKDYSTEIVDFTINEKSVPADRIMKERKEEDNTIEETWRIKLEGEYTYRIKFTRTKKYKFDDDFFIGFRATHIVKGLRMRLTYPKDMDALFTCRGTLCDFVNDVSNVGDTIAKNYEGIIFPRQGYLIPLKLKKNAQTHRKK